MLGHLDASRSEKSDSFLKLSAFIILVLELLKKSFFHFPNRVIITPVHLDCALHRSSLSIFEEFYTPNGITALVIIILITVEKLVHFLIF